MAAAICEAICSTPADNSCLAGSNDANILNKIQSQNLMSPTVVVPYNHPLVRQSTFWMSQKSLEMCTESLGSETGANDLDDRGWFITSATANVAMENTGRQEDFGEAMNGRRELLSSVNYHCTGRKSPPRSFPPPLTSISCRNGPCIQMRTSRLDGRLVVTAIPVPLLNYIHARRHEGRLLLSFIEMASSNQSSSAGLTSTQPEDQPNYSNYGRQIKEPEYVNLRDEDKQQVDEEKEQEELDVVDRRPVVEEKVSTQPRQQKGAIKMSLSSIVIKKIGRGAPLGIKNRSPAGIFFYHRHTGICRAESNCYLKQAVFYIVFTSKRRKRKEILYKMRLIPAAQFHLGATMHCYILKNSTIGESISTL